MAAHLQESCKEAMPILQASVITPCDMPLQQCMQMPVCMAQQASWVMCPAVSTRFINWCCNQVQEAEHD